MPLDDIPKAYRLPSGPWTKLRASAGIGKPSWLPSKTSIRTSLSLHPKQRNQRFLSGPRTRLLTELYGPPSKLVYWPDVVTRPTNVPRTHRLPSEPVVIQVTTSPDGRGSGNSVTPPSGV